MGEIRELLNDSEILDSDKFDVSSESDSSIEIFIIRQRLETDNEYMTRIKEAKRLEKFYMDITKNQRRSLNPNFFSFWDPNHLN